MITLFPKILTVLEIKAFKQWKKKSASDNVKYAMSGIKSSRTRRAKKQENTTHDEKNRSTETAAKISQIVDKDIKTIIGKCTYMFTAYPQGHKYILFVNSLGMDFVYIHNRSQDTIFFFFYCVVIQLANNHEWTKNISFTNEVFTYECLLLVYSVSLFV